MHLTYPLVLSALLFAIGVYGVLARRNAILVLMGVELMLNAVNLNLVAFDAYLRDALHGGQVLTLFVITIAAAEVGLGLAIVLLVFRHRATSDVLALDALGERGYDEILDADTDLDRAAEVEEERRAEAARAASPGVPAS
jgi:NADH-quinone oxidoreductase subunit K